MTCATCITASRDLESDWRPWFGRAEFETTFFTLAVGVATCLSELFVVGLVQKKLAGAAQRAHVDIVPVQENRAVSVYLFSGLLVAVSNLIVSMCSARTRAACSALPKEQSRALFAAACPRWWLA